MAYQILGKELEIVAGKHIHKRCQASSTGRLRSFDLRAMLRNETIRHRDSFRISAAGALALDDRKGHARPMAACPRMLDIVSRYFKHMPIGGIATQIRKQIEQVPGRHSGGDYGQQLNGPRPAPQFSHSFFDQSPQHRSTKSDFQNIGGRSAVCIQC